MAQSFGGMSSKHSFLIGVGTTLGVISFVGLIIMLITVAFANDERDRVDTISANGNTENTIPDAGNAMGGHSGTGSGVRVSEVTADDHIRGNPEAKISVIEYSDFECPFCSRLHPTLTRLIEEYDGNVKWVYRHFPLNIHRNAETAAHASECAAAQGKFWDFADQLFERQTSLGDSTYSTIAREVGLSVSAFEQCMESGTYRSKVSAHFQQASTAGGRGTPYTVIVSDSGETIPVSGAVPYEQFQGIISNLL